MESDKNKCSFKKKNQTCLEVQNCASRVGVMKWRNCVLIFFSLIMMCPEIPADNNNVVSKRS